jgi:hypothetical protein
VQVWLEREPAVASAVLFGSSVRSGAEPAAADEWSDLDLHVVTAKAEQLLRTDWKAVFPAAGFALQVVRPASGGMRKATILLPPVRSTSCWCRCRRWCSPGSASGADSTGVPVLCAWR